MLVLFPALLCAESIRVHFFLVLSPLFFNVKLFFFFLSLLIFFLDFILFRGLGGFPPGEGVAEDTTKRNKSHMRLVRFWLLWSDLWLERGEDFPLLHFHYFYLTIHFLEFLLVFQVHPLLQHHQVLQRLLFCLKLFLQE